MIFTGLNNRYPDQSDGEQKSPAKIAPIPTESVLGVSDVG